MNKTKLTLYIDKEIVDKAKKISKLTGKSVSGLFSDYLNEQDIENSGFKVSEKIEKWIGIANSGEEYKKLRDRTYEEKLKKYESTS